MSELIKIALIAVFLLPLSMGQSTWTSNDELFATAHGDEGMGMFSDVHKTVDSVIGHKEFISSLNASNVDDVSFTSSSYLTMLDENGELNTTGSIITESLKFPYKFSVSMTHNQYLDNFIDPKNMTEGHFSNIDIIPKPGQGSASSSDAAGMAESSLEISPDTNGSDSFSMTSTDDSFLPDDILDWIHNPDKVGNIVDDSVSELGNGVTIDKLKNLEHEITFDHPHLSTKNGETCYWGESKNKMIRLV
ncbi:MAG TPA: hypothetical protein VN455_02650 [Methanotrichaceae archaeon]|nr:hypothetical protein [Methanotrichaceae archaeon]